MAELRRQLGKPISEHLNTEEDLLLYKEHEAVDLANIAVCGNGIARAKYLFDFAHSIGLGTLHGTTQELSIGTAAAAHVMASLDSIDAPCDPAGPLLYQQDCAKKRVQYEDSHLIVPEGPGLGIEVDEDLLEAQAYTGSAAQATTEFGRQRRALTRNEPGSPKFQTCKETTKCKNGHMGQRGLTYQ